MAWRYEQRSLGQMVKDSAVFAITQARLKQNPHSPVAPSEQGGRIIAIEPRVWSGFAGKEIRFVDKLGPHVVGALDLSNSIHSFEVGLDKPRQLQHNKEFGTYAVLPLGPVDTTDGNYRNGPAEKTRFNYFASLGKDATKLYGNSGFAKRFGEGFSYELEAAYAGGIAISDGKLQVCNLEELQAMDAQGKPVAQLHYSWKAKEDLPEQSWTHGKGEKERQYQPIKGSVANWSWYLQSTDGQKTYFLAAKIGADSDSGNFVFNCIKEINYRLLEGRDWKAALSVFGFGAGFVIKRGKNRTYGSHQIPFTSYHANPFYLVARPQNP